MKLKSIPAKLGYIVGAQWTRDLAWTAFTILLARKNPDALGQIVLALTFGYLPPLLEVSVLPHQSGFVQD